MSKASVEDLRRLSQFLDSKFRLPGGFKFGWDGLLGLIPGFGDISTNIMALYILIRGAHLGVSVPVILRMGLNILIDNLVDFIPLIGGLFDFMWKSNQKNLALIENHLKSPAATRKKSILTVVVVTSILVILLLGLLTLSIQFAIYIFQLAQGYFQNQQW